MTVQIAAMNDCQMCFPGKNVGERIIGKNDKQQKDRYNMDDLANMLSHETMTPTENLRDAADFK
jgi:hypothetical protein